MIMRKRNYLSQMERVSLTGHEADRGEEELCGGAKGIVEGAGVGASWRSGTPPLFRGGGGLFVYSIVFRSTALKVQVEQLIDSGWGTLWQVTVRQKWTQRECNGNRRLKAERAGVCFIRSQIHLHTYQCTGELDDSSSATPLTQCMHWELAYTNRRKQLKINKMKNIYISMTVLYSIIYGCRWPIEASLPYDCQNS